MAAENFAWNWVFSFTSVTVTCQNARYATNEPKLETACVV